MRLYTLRWGNVWWLRRCGETLNSYCERNGYQLHVWGKSRGAGYPATKFSFIDMLKEFLGSDDEWMGYVDSDVYVHEDCPPLPLDKWRGFMVRPDGLPWKSFSKWVHQHYAGELSVVPRSWSNRNAGVWFCDRDAAKKMLEHAQPPYLQGLQEQHQFNWFLIHAQRDGLLIGELPECFNQWWNRPGTACFHHVSGRGKVDKFKQVIKNMNKNTWKQFDRGEYGFGIKGSENMEADDLHVDLLYRCTLLPTHRPDGEKIVVEVGSFKGTTTTALLTAVDECRVAHLHIVEVRPTPDLKRRIALCKFPDRVTLHTKPSWEVDLVDKPDLVFIDGDHTWPALADTLRMISWGAHTIAFHDSHAWPEFKRCWGSTMACNMLRDCKEFVEWSDHEKREGMRTHRGFSVFGPDGSGFGPLDEIIESITDVKS